jgi:hypothetical protein
VAMTQVIVIAHGIEMWEFGLAQRLQDFLTKHCVRQGGVTPAAGENNTWLYPKGAAEATHEIRVVYKMADLASALDVTDAFVIYEGHARYGQGPAFGPDGVTRVPDKKKFPVNPWGVHFRMGHDATDTECVDDLLEHSVVPVEYDLRTADPKGFLPKSLMDATIKVQAREKAITAKKTTPKGVCAVSGAWRSMDVCQQTLATTKTARDDLPLSGRHYYLHQDRAKPEEFLTAVEVGSADLDKAMLACNVFFMASCSSKVHFRAALVRRRKATKSSCKFLLTAHVCSASHSTSFLKQVLLKKRDPMSKDGMKKIVRALNGESRSGIVGVY